MIDQIKTLPSPPALVGTIMELMLTLLKTYRKDSIQPLMQSTSHDPRKKATTGSVSTKMEKEQWLQLQIAIGDSQRFLDLINNLKWEEGLPKEAIDLIESKLATSHNSKNGGTSQPWTSDSSSSRSDPPNLITVSMAKHASESAAVMCEFAIAIVEYQYSFEPHRIAVLNVEKLKKQLAGLCIVKIRTYMCMYRHNYTYMHRHTLYYTVVY